MSSEKINSTVFYTLEKSIKSYRQFAQRNISKVNTDITIDQWLVLKTLQENPAITQQQLAINIFKDYASITRIINLLVNKEYLKRSFHVTDRRRSELTVTKKGIKLIESLQPIIHSNRMSALRGISKDEIEQLQKTLSRLIRNTGNN